MKERTKITAAVLTAALLLTGCSDSSQPSGKLSETAIVTDANGKENAVPVIDFGSSDCFRSAKWGDDYVGGKEHRSNP